MRTENNTTDKIDKRDLLRIFSNSIGAVCTHRKENFAPRKLIAVGGWDDEPYIRLRMMGFSHIANELLKHCEWSLNLKPLQEISEKDKTDIFQIEFGIYPDTANEIEWGSGWKDTWVKQSGMGTKLSLEATDFLRSRGYALPYGKYSVDDLVEAGIYKLTK